MAARFTTIKESSLFRSEPNPAWFGNEGNPTSRPKGWDAKNWLTSRFHFSFAEWSDGKPNFGVLRVLNDDRVQPARGFGTHPHRDMEIVTYIVEGELTHQDSMGTAETLGRGAVQFMTAGTGVRHSEHNLSPEKPLRFIQMWIMPKQRGLKPNYGSAVGEDAARHNKWAHVVGAAGAPGAQPPVAINQDANIFVSELDGGLALPFEVKAGRQVYFVCLEGDVTVGHSEGASTALEAHDAAEVVGAMQLDVKAGPAGAHCLVVEMAAQ